jgi:hypothetical protein
MDEATKAKAAAKRSVKRRCLAAEIGLPDALPELMFEHEMDRGDALRYLGL